MVASVEKWNPHGGVRQDLFGFGDLCAVYPSTDADDDGLPTIALVQVTDGSHHANRKKKILAEPNAKKWKDACGVILLHSWSRRGKMGERKVWTLREEVL